MPDLHKAPLPGTSFTEPLSGELVPDLFGKGLLDQLLASDSATQKQLQRLQTRPSGPRSRSSRRRTHARRPAERAAKSNPPRLVGNMGIEGRPVPTHHRAISECLAFWATLTSDPTLLEAVKGYKLPLTGCPPLTYYKDGAVSVTLKPAIVTALRPHVEKMEVEGVIERVKPNTKVFVSSMFSVPKSDGSIRPVINLRGLNYFLLVPKFKMEGLFLIQSLVRRGEMMAKIDFSQAYFSIRISPEHRHLLAFPWEGGLYMFRRLPFGLASAPLIFSKLMIVLAQHLREQGVRLIVYLDDWFLVASDSQTLSGHISLAIDLFEKAGLTINREKSVLRPTQSITFLGIEIRSDRLSWNIPEEKLVALRGEAEALLSGPGIARHLARFLGRLAFYGNLCPEIPFRIRNLQRFLAGIVNPKNVKSYENELGILPEECTAELLWWVQSARAELQPVSFAVFSPLVTITTDASGSGWGAVCCGKRAGGRWSLEEKECHINILELRAILFGLRVFAHKWKDCDVCLETDNTAAVAYLNNSGGTVSPALSSLAFEIWAWCRERNIRFRVAHRPGSENQIADFESRCHYRDCCEWSIDRSTINGVFKLWGYPQIDLFASRINHKVPRFFSFFADPEAVAIDAFAQRWSDPLSYAFPPFSLLGRVMEKSRLEEADLIVITPLWRAQPWFPLLLARATVEPILLPRSERLITDPTGNPHPLLTNRSFRLLAWRISGKDGEGKACLSASAIRSWPRGLSTLGDNTTLT